MSPIGFLIITPLLWTLRRPSVSSLPPHGFWVSFSLKEKETKISGSRISAPSVGYQPGIKGMVGIRRMVGMQGGYLASGYQVRVRQN